MNTQDSVAALEEETASLRRNLTQDPNQLPEIHSLYHRYVELGRPFPADLEEHSLWLILRFIRPDDDNVAGRLIAVLQAQGKRFEIIGPSRFCRPLRANCKPSSQPRSVDDRAGYATS